MANFNEMLALIKILASLGITKIKLTGGEPGLYPNLEALIENMKAIQGIEEISMTTNGCNMQGKMQAFKNAGLTAITFSIDTLDCELYQKITGINSLAPLLKTIDEACQAGLKVKINCVPFGMNQESFCDVALLAKKQDIQVRFIEMMPIGLGQKFQTVNGKQILQALQERFGKLNPIDKHFGNGPASYFHIDGWKGNIGLIFALSHEFCASCNRIRITSDMHFQGCLNAKQSVDLKPYLQEGELEECRRLLQELIYHKPARHGFEKEGQAKKMNQIGG
jgi:cyclic pyranopterin phosphate synthase